MLSVGFGPLVGLEYEVLSRVGIGAFYGLNFEYGSVELKADAGKIERLKFATVSSGSVEACLYF